MPYSAEACPIPASAGIGLRAELELGLIEELPSIAWLEAHSENYFGDGGRPLANLRTLRKHYPISLHGIGLGLGNTAPLDAWHLNRLKRLVNEIEPIFVSEHLCWNAFEGRHFNDLPPLPFTQASVVHIAHRIQEVQEFIGQELLVENVSSYLEFESSEMSEWEFMTEVARIAGCRVLLDVNNVYVNAQNHGYSAEEFIRAIPPDKIAEVHLAGHTHRIFEDGSEIRLDTHDQPVCPEVWQLYAALLDRVGTKPTLLERDANLPPLAELIDEAMTAERLLRERTPESARRIYS